MIDIACRGTYRLSCFRCGLIVGIKGDWVGNVRSLVTSGSLFAGLDDVWRHSNSVRATGDEAVHDFRLSDVWFVLGVFSLVIRGPINDNRKTSTSSILAAVI